MAFRTIDEIKQQGFVGFVPISSLCSDSSVLPRVKGVYIVLNLRQGSPAFLETGCGGYFKGKDPNVSIEELKRNWVEVAPVVYIGKAGGVSSAATLQSRLRQYLHFGQGKNIGHRGGRLIWQLEHSKDLVVCWKTLPSPEDDPRAVEAQLIKEFVSEFAARPFANLAD